MASSLMTKTQQFRGLWALPPGIAATVPSARLPRYLAVTEGRVWLTRSGGRDEAVPDVWLAAGEEAAIAPGVEVVVEGWPSARFALLEAAVEAPFSVKRAVSLLRRWRERAQWTPRPAPCA